MTILLHDGIVITQDSNRRVFRGDVFIQDGAIAYVGEECSRTADIIIDAHEKIVMPGIINSHVHLGESVYMSMIATRLPLDEYLRQTELLASRNPEYVEGSRDIAAGYTLAQLVRSGVTTIAGGRTATVAEKYGVRNVSGYMLMNYGKLGKFSVDIEAQFANEVRLHDSPLTSHALFIHSLATVSPSELSAAQRLLAEYPECRLMAHIAETREVVARTREIYECSELDTLEHYGFLNDRFLAVHACYLATPELRRLRDSGAHLAHCLTSNMASSSRTLNRRDMSVLGNARVLATDGIVTSGTFSLLEEASYAYKYHNRYTAQDWLTPQQLLDDITIKPAKALGLDGITGSIEVGKRADIVILGLDVSLGIDNAVSQLIYYAQAVSIKTVIIDGVITLLEGELSKELARCCAQFHKLTEQLT